MSLLYCDGLVAGVDEVGRGPLVGNVVTAAVILDPAKPIDGLRDSKKCCSKQRDALRLLIQEHAIAFALGRATPAEIDQLNILQATMLAMTRAVEQLKVSPSQVLIDGNRVPPLTIPTRAIVKGDDVYACIAAASILAKVARDQEMLELDERYPEYGFAKHKGYPTLEHRKALTTHGVLPEHRTTYAPVKACLTPE